MESSSVDCPEWVIPFFKESGGCISFADFMDLALNHPDYGAYSSGRLKIGKHGDFVTSPSMGADFAELLSLQLVEWIKQLQINEHIDNVISLVDIGPGEGDLTLQLINSIRQHSPALLSQLQILLIEPNEGMRVRQQEKLSHIKDVVYRWTNFRELSKEPIIGILLAHEILDALPVDRITSKSNKLYLQGVTLEKVESVYKFKLADLPIPKSISLQIDSFQEQHNINIPPKDSPDGWTSEWHTSLPDWFKNASSALNKGFLLIIDYAMESSRYYHINRTQGTLLSYKDQLASNNVLKDFGCCDLTAHLCIESLLDNATLNNWSYLGQTKQGLALLALGLAEKLHSLQDLSSKDFSLALSKRENLLRLVDPRCLGEFMWIAFQKNNPYDKSQILETPFFLKDP